MFDLEELNAPFDPFVEALDEERHTAISVNNDDLRIQQRNGRKTMTMLEGLPREYDINKIVKTLRKKCACIGTIIENEESYLTLKFSGDQRQKIAEFLVREKIAKKSEITIHGF
ncbi:translation initiation factor SUI1 [Dichotomocladium elegans]|nr:translation initiation factor SUI1 [Dichotomocladium elegans]